MTDLIDAIIRTRKTAGDICAKSLEKIEDLSEVEMAEKILVEIKNHTELLPEGYYNPPPAGVGVLFDEKPFERLRYDSLRNEKYWPSNDSKFSKDAVGMIYFSPLDRETNMLGDIGCTIYKGDDPEIKEHIRKSYETLLAIAEHTKVGMKFSDICSFASNLIQGKFKLTRWITRNSAPEGMNLGHTIPGSYEELNFGKTFEEVKNTITKKRIFIKEITDFKIPETCAFTIESRLEDAHKPHLPSVHFHFIVCFDKGKKKILSEFDTIFKAINMDYMQITQPAK